MPTSAPSVTEAPSSDGSLPRGRIPSLDGIRAIAVSLVILAHVNGTRFFPIPYEYERFINVGNLGVRVFFVLSGFLITTLLIREHQRTGRISLSGFYMRRLIRIFPALYVFVAVMGVATFTGLVDIPLIDFAWASTYTINYFTDRSWEFGHLWSLAVEEQFYLTWPLLVILFTPKRVWWIAFLAIGLAPLSRVATWVFMPEHREWIESAFHTVFDALATGCLLALLRVKLDQSKAYLRLMSSPIIILLPFVIYACNFYRQYPSFMYTVGETIMNICIALLIDWAIRNPDGRVGRMLNARFAAFIGVMSYSLYLWQQPFLNRESDAWATAFPINIVLATVFAFASYRLIETPLLGLRAKFRHAKMQDSDQPTASNSASS